MKTAIATFATRVSPRFDCAQSILVVTTDEGEPSNRQELSTSDWAPHERVNRLLELGVDTVICGGIDRWSSASFQSAGVTVYGWVTGEAEDALAALLRGDLDCEAATEGAGRCRCRRFPADDGEQSQSPGSGAGTRGRGRRAGRGRGGRGGAGPGRLR
jgi:predicted Fe-Mo cluster-binding NifX family protein